MTAATNSRYYIGGGNIAGIIGVSPYRTPLDEYHTIMGSSKELTAANENFFKRRKALEPFAAAVLAERGFSIVEQNRRVTDSVYPFMKAELDAETTLVGSEIRNAEFKSVHPLAAKAWGIDGDGDGAPDYVTAQGLWGLGVSGREICDVFAVIGFDDSRAYPVRRADDVIDFMRHKAIHFWEQHILAECPPAPSNVEDILKWIKPDASKVVEASDHLGLETTVKDYLVARTAAKVAEDELEKLKTKIQLVLCDATALTVAGKTVLTWKRNKDSEHTDWRGLALELKPSEDLYQRFTTSKPGNRVFRVVAEKQ